ncbi:hypothetical protein SBOR_9216 [Sclerotinia borealis F-4128]|uniref:Uncharacterized protein n=1 Tax=Sclerotinia borealis (strain F-4128) TaxID=1432307 RepID=W9C776_SCLBF|nr:hypothetical protein SBOR_9216 [Sclerotinia borealis F-4128]
MPLSNIQKPSTEGPTKKASTAKLRKRPPPKDRDGNGDITRSGTSIASRKRRCPRVTLASLQMDDEEDDPSRFTTSFGANSHSHNTWGLPVSTTIVATKRKRRTATFQDIPGLGRNHAGRSAGLFNHIPKLRSLETTPEHVDINCPTRSCFLRYSLEVRERIYGYFLRSPKSIIMNHDWTTVERCPDFVIKEILFICKQITAEALTFLYKNNTFHALLRENKSWLPFWSISRIPSTYLNLIRNVILECPKDSWSLDWYHKAAKSIETLAMTKPVLDTFTLVMTPQRVELSSTALGLEAAPMTFANFLWKDGEILIAIMKLHSKKLRVVVKNDDGRRIILEVDVGGIYTTLDDQESWFEKDRLYQQTRLALKKRVETELAAMKDRLEEIFNGERKAIKMGWCRIMGLDERLVGDKSRRYKGEMSGGWMAPV